MGMGEPLANEAAVWAAIERIHDDIGLSARHITVSTVGVVPGIRALATRRLPVTLAVSIHAANDALRDELVPLNRRYPLDASSTPARSTSTSTGRRVSFEWAMIDGVNDRPERRRRAGRAGPPAAPGRTRQPDPAQPDPGLADDRLTRRHVSAEFRDRLDALGVGATVRRNRGTDIDAACGQLAAARAQGRLTA